MYILSKLFWWLLPSIIVLGLGGAALVWEHRENVQARDELRATHEGDLRELRGQLQTLIAAHQTLADAVSETQSENTTLTRRLEEEQERVRDVAASVEREVERVTDTVGDLERLAKTDPELLQKYSRVFFLNEHYTPARLEEIEKEYLYHEDQTQRIHAEVHPYLMDMLEEAQDDGIELYVKSAYRSFDEQQAVKGQHTVVYGEGTANQFSADQGYSEHQLGTTVDLITTGIGGVLEGFGGTEAFAWLEENAHEYGFTLSYPEGNQYYVYEPWHWRFVGVELAEDLHADGKHFYDLDQREIDEYRGDMFE